MHEPDRTNWREMLAEAVQTKHYERIGEGLAGAPVDVAVRTILVDVLHICEHHQLPFDELLEAARAQCQKESAQLTSKREP